jgi:hypothetical protein
MPEVTLVFIFQVILLAGICATVLKLLKTGLFRRYPWFFAYFASRIPGTACLFILNVRSTAYWYFWIATILLGWFFYIQVVREVYSLVLERHRGIYTLGRWVLYCAVAVSGTISLLTLPQSAPGRSLLGRIGAYISACDRGITLSLAIFLFIMLLLLSQYLTVLSRNVVVHSMLFAIYFFTTTVYNLVRTFFGIKVAGVSDTALLGASAVCVWSWFFLLSREGEKARMVLPLLTQEHEGRLLAQLDTLNDTLMKSGKK